jgi:hypothetical protein
MALILADRVLETTTTTGTGAIALAAAVTGYRRFSAVCATNDTVYYSIIALDANGNPSGDWETGLGTYSSANTLTRTTPLASTNAGAAVNFAAGTKYAMLSEVAGSFKYLVGFFFTTVPTVSEVLCLHVAAADFTIPANLSTLKSSVGTNPTSSFALDVQNNGVTIGTITVATNGAVTATTTSGTAKAIAAGDVLKIVAPSPVDATAANMTCTLVGQR